MWTTGGCHDNQACFCVTGGQLSLCQRRGREGGREMVENEGGSDEEKRVNAGMNSLNDCILLFYRLFLLQNLLPNVYAVLSNNYFFIHTHSGQCNHSATRSFHHQLVFRMQWPLTEDSKSWPSGNKTVFSQAIIRNTTKTYAGQKCFQAFISMLSLCAHALFQYFSRVLLQRGEASPLISSLLLMLSSFPASALRTVR